jgi:hypothetical protein
VAGSNHHKGRPGQPLFGRRSNSFSASSCRRVLAQCREFAVLEHVAEIGELVPSRARPLELIAELLQRHPLQRLLNGTTVTASPRQRQHTRRAPGQAAERQGHQLRIQTRGNAEPFSRGIGDRSPIPCDMTGTRPQLGSGASNNEPGPRRSGTPPASRTAPTARPLKACSLSPRLADRAITAMTDGQVLPIVFSSFATAARCCSSSSFRCWSCCRASAGISPTSAGASACGVRKILAR